MSNDWPFADPRNVAVLTVRQIIRDGEIIQHVMHDIDDGTWQFLQLNTPDVADAMVVALDEIVQIDPTVAELADLPLGWHAMRNILSDPWQREPKPSAHENKGFWWYLRRLFRS
jgi:hypothetical protein